MADSSAVAEAISDLVAANRILANEGVLDGFGHVSVRHPAKGDTYLVSRSIAPALVGAADVLELDFDNRAVHAKDRDARLYYERWLHGEIYKARADVNAIVHSHSPTVVPFASTKAPLRPLLHNASFLGFGAPIFEIRTVVRNSDLMISSAPLAKAMVGAMGSACVVLLRGHGNVVVGAGLPQVVFRSVYTEINARLQAQAMALGPVTYLDPEEARRAESSIAGTLGRPWELWRKKALGR